MQIPPLSPLALAQLIGVSADIALLLDEAGVVQEVSLSRSTGQPWTVGVG